MDEPEEDVPAGGSRTAGTCLIVALVTGGAAVLLVVAPVAGTLVFWTVMAVWLWWGVSRPNKIDIPSPPPPEPLPEEGKPQFTVVDDPENPARHIVVWSTKKEQ